MPKKILQLLFVAGLLIIGFSAEATHNRAGEISIEPIDECTLNRVRATIRTYTKASSVAADRDSLLICWGDGICEMVARSNGGGFGVLLPNDTKYNEYIAIHQYAGRSSYQISMTDPNRNGEILNVNFPNSETVAFHLQTNYTFPNCQFGGFNFTPTLEQPPIDIGCVGQRFEHNPNAFDPDGDSLSYELIVPLQDLNTPVPNYLWPDQVGVSADNNYDLNEVTGDFIWDAPQTAGEYNIAMYIISWRNGSPIDTVLRDMQILIEDCDDNRPPTIESPDFICVVAGETVSFEVTGDDPDQGQFVELTALGGPFVVDINPAQFNVDPGYQPPPVKGTFVWNTSCEHISDQPYTIVFKAIDDYFDNFGLATLKTVRIKVVGPPPEDVQADPGSGEIKVNWEQPYVCEDAAEDYFYTFTVWRKDVSQEIIIDTCTPGLDGQGYTLINANSREIEDGRYIYIDTDVERGRTYCYRILALFAKYSTIGQPFNIVESLPSNEVCVQLSRDVPLITNVDVLETDVTNGEIEVKWAKPVEEDLDPQVNPPPYTYEILRADGITDTGFQPIGISFTGNDLQEIDTSFIDTGLDTRNQAYSYRIRFLVEGDRELGNSPHASSVFLSIASTDETNNLSWDFDVPWDNTDFIVFRQNAQLTFDSIAQVEDPFYSDQGLINGREYCYFIRASGDYGIDGIISPLINNSQIACGVPLDTIPPCPPELTVSNICDQAVSCIEAELTNDLSWINPMFLCEETDDVVGYRVYYAPLEGSEFELIESIDFADDTTYTHRPDLGIAGCYAVTAVDTFFNESAFSNIICVDNCPIYELPNTFTPNGDGQNDLFVPYPYCFVERVDFRVFNRWGELVFQTSDADLNWNGNNKNNQPLPDGTYYYTCQVFEQRVSGVTPNPNLLSGFIELLRSR
jgi:gliding motility-associated-like protein